MRLTVFCVALLTATVAVGQEDAGEPAPAATPKPEPDWKAAYEKANASAAAWKDLAEKRKGEIERLKAEMEKTLAFMVQLKEDLAKLRFKAEVNEAAKKRDILPSAARQGAPSSGEPADVNAAIRRDAAEKWPGDYHMQEFEINRQTESYRKLHGR